MVDCIHVNSDRAETDARISKYDSLYDWCFYKSCGKLTLTFLMQQLSLCIIKGPSILDDRFPPIAPSENTNA